MCNSKTGFVCVGEGEGAENKWQSGKFDNRLRTLIPLKMIVTSVTLGEISFTVNESNQMPHFSCSKYNNDIYLHHID